MISVNWPTNFATPRSVILSERWNAMALPSIGQAPLGPESIVIQMADAPSFTTTTARILSREKLSAAFSDLLIGPRQTSRASVCFRHASALRQTPSPAAPHAYPLWESNLAVPLLSLAPLQPGSPPLVPALRQLGHLL